MSVSIEQLLYQDLIATPAFTSLLGVAGSLPAFYDKQLPQQIFTTLSNPATPFIAGTYQRIASPRLFFQGPGPLQATMGRARFQLTFWSNAKTGTADLDNVDRAVKTFFQTFDAVNPASSPPTFIQASFISYASRTLIEPQTQPTLQKLEIDVEFWFSDQ